VDAMAKHLQARWNTPAPPIVRCTPGLFPTPGFFVEVDDGTTNRTGVLADDGTTELVAFASESTVVATTVVECSTVDLDGDGVDEIVETWQRAPQGTMAATNWLEVRSVREHAFAKARGPFTSVYHPDLGGCSAEVKLAGHTIVVEVHNLPGIPPSDCLAQGTHTFALDKGAVIELAARVTSR